MERFVPNTIEPLKGGGGGGGKGACCTNTAPGGGIKDQGTPSGHCYFYENFGLSEITLSP